MTRYQALTVSTLVATLLLIGVGSLVRTTGSGLGCPDWPLCHGNLIPPLERAPMIEWSHRTVAAFTGTLIIIEVGWTLSRRRHDRTRVMLALCILPLLLLQALLGREAVIRELPPAIVAVHMVSALLLYAFLALLATFAWLGDGREPRSARQAGPGRSALVAAALAGLVMVVGAYTVSTGAGFACTAWPGCPEASVPLLDGGRLQHIHWLHRITVVAAFAASVALVVGAPAWRDARPRLFAAAQVLLAMYVVQMVVGAANIWSDFSEVARVAHLMVGATIWSLAVSIAAAVPYERSRAATPSASPASLASPG